jgi:hypothetical protein
MNLQVVAPSAHFRKHTDLAGPARVHPSPRPTPPPAGFRPATSERPS